MGTAFFDEKHKVDKLHGTICLYKSEPYYVACAIYDNRTGQNKLKDGQVSLHPLGPDISDQKKSFIVEYTDKDFDYTAPPLGYANWREEASYMMRVPKRDVHQGLHMYSIICAEGSKPRDIYGWFTSSSMRDCIVGNYPTLNEAMDLTTPSASVRHKSVAFARTLAVSGLGLGAGHVLHFKGRSIANRVNKDEFFTLYPGPDRSFLMKYCSRNGVYVC